MRVITPYNLITSSLALPAVRQFYKCQFTWTGRLRIMAINLESAIDGMRRRGAYRAIAAYAVGVFALWQASDIVVSALGLPQHVMRLVVLGAAAGLPLVIAIAWFPDVSASDRRRRTTARMVVISGVVGAAALGAVLLASPGSPNPGGGDNPSLERGIELFFSGHHARAASILSQVAADVSLPISERHDALRYLARAHEHMEDPAAVQRTLARLLELEPPMVLLVPGVESDALMAAYSELRRRSGGAGAPLSASTIVVEVLPFVERGELVGMGIGEGIAAVVLNDLFADAAGVKFVDRSTLEITPAHGYDIYRFIDAAPTEAQRRQAARGSAFEPLLPTHMIFGAVTGNDGQMFIKVWIVDAATGLEVASDQVVGRVDGTSLLITKLSSSLRHKVPWARDTIGGKAIS
jgi:hypothetical protein